VFRGWGRISNMLLQGSLSRATGILPRFSRDANCIHLVSLGCNEVPPSRYGGIELVVANLAVGLRDLGLRIRVYSPGTLHVSGIEHSQTLLQPSTKVDGRANANDPAHLNAVRKELEQRVKPGDVVILNHPDHYSHLHSGIQWRWRAHVLEIAHWTFVSLPDHIVYPSHALQAEISKPGWVIPHGIDLQFKSADVERDSFLFFAGRLTRDKGLDIASEAAQLAGVELVLAGPRPDQSFAAELLSRSHVKYVGELSYAELLEYYERAAAVVYMTQYTEPFGLTAIEAMAMGCPVIATGLGGTGETIVDGLTGYYCQTADEIAAIIPRLSSLAEEAIVAHARRYTRERMASDYLALFAGL